MFECYEQLARVCCRSHLLLLIRSSASSVVVASVAVERLAAGTELAIERGGVALLLALALAVARLEELHSWRFPRMASFFYLFGGSIAGKK